MMKFLKRGGSEPTSRPGSKVEKAVLATIFAVLFTVDLQWGILRRFVEMIQEMQSAYGSVALSGGFALWVGGFAYAARRRAELSEAKKARAAAEEAAETLGVLDALTGLPNRQGLKAELSRRVATMTPEGAGGTIFAFDVDRFKMLNDVRGNVVGDQVLVEISDRLAMAVEDGDFVARVGADEFHVLSTIDDPDTAKIFAEKLQNQIGRPIHNGPAPLQVHASVAFARYGGEDEASDPTSIVRRVDIALQYAKADGGSGLSSFEDDMEMSIRERAQLERDLEVAIATGQIQPHFQPVIDLQSNSITGFEVLARWDHPERGLISPSVFIPIAEEMGKLGELTKVILRRACGAARDWPANIKLAVNISPIDFKNPWLAQEILQTLTEVGFPPQRLELEITENALVVDHEQAMKTITSLKNQGISIALDDFGTGYSSLHHLRVLPFGKIKIDQSFVKTMRDNADSRMIVKAIIGLSGSLGLPTTAEGIETNNNADILRDLGCTLGQGFLFSKAVPSKEVPQLLDALAEQAVHPEYRPDVEGIAESELKAPHPSAPHETAPAAEVEPVADAAAPIAEDGEDMLEAARRIA